LLYTYTNSSSLNPENNPNFRIVPISPLALKSGILVQQIYSVLFYLIFRYSEVEVAFDMPVEDLVFSSGGFLFGAVAGYTIKKIMT